MSKKILLQCLFFILYISSSGDALPIQDRKIDSMALVQLATGLGISPEKDLVAETQKHWLRRSGQERWEMTELSSEKRAFVLQWAEEQKFLSSWHPLYPTYDYAVILGSATSRMEKRLAYLQKVWEEGTRFKEIFWLTGDRPLDKRIDGLTDRCANETEAAHILWEETDLPKEMRDLPVHFIALPMNGQRRPNTEDTIIAWVEKVTQPCTALFFSDQPFCGYQFAVIKTWLPDACDFDVVGPGAEEEAKRHPIAAAIILDSIARWIYQETFYR